MKGIIIAGSHSGVGKTSVALGLMAALRRRGLTVAPFKVGPDFIDPGHHATVAGSVSRNLDGWMLRREYNLATLQRHGARSDVAVVEGVMGLFDGFSGRSEEGSTAQMAKWLNLPVVLVVDAASMARSAAALVQGFERFDPDLAFAGVVFNKLGSKGHLDYLREAMSRHVGMPLIGGLMRDERISMGERHLGLVTSEDRPLSVEGVNLLADRIEADLDLDQLLADMPEVRCPSPAAGSLPAETPDAVCIGVARDQAFCFYYQDNLDLLGAAGARLVPFSPVRDTRLPDDLDGIYLGGGYPELHAQQLATNVNMRQAIRNCSRAGMPIYAECGGFMYLGRELADLEGGVYPMCGCFPFQSRMNRRLRSLGYREIRLDRDTPLGSRGAILRGHEFHYSSLAGDAVDEDIATVYAVSDHRGAAAQAQGYMTRRTLGSYIHLHFGSRPASAAAFVAACRAFRHERS